MPPKETKPPTFLTRDQLSFQEGTTFSLIVNLTTAASNGGSYFLRGMTKEGPFTYKIKSGGVGTKQIFTLRIPDIPIFISITPDEAFQFSNDSWFVVKLSVNGDVGLILTSGFLNSSFGISWPTQQQNNGITERGILQIVQIANPSAGYDFSTQVPDNEVWKLITLKFIFTASATVANRRPLISIGTNGGQEILLPCAADIVASTYRKITYMQGGANLEDSTGLTQTAILPRDLLINRAQYVQSAVRNIQAADQIENIFLFIQKYYVG